MTLMLAVTLMIQPIMVFASDVANIDYSQNKKLSEMTDQELMQLATKHEFLDTEGLKISKLSVMEKANMLKSSVPIDISETNVYIMEKKISNAENEKVVVADVAIPARASGGENKATKEGRVTITSVIGYETISKNGVQYKKGKYYGGFVNAQQVGTRVTSLKGTYHDVGPYITASGGSGIGIDYTTSTNFSVSGFTKLQTKQVSRDRYFNTNASPGSVDAKFTATYMVQNNTYTIAVTAQA